jgi:hypothetical protein
VEDTDRSNQLRTRAANLREQARNAVERADAMPRGAMGDMLRGEAKILADAAVALEAQALALAPPLGTA